MAHTIAIPKLGLTMTDCTLVSWAKEDGDKVTKGDVLYTIETEKIASDIEADSDGFLQRIAEPGITFDVGAVVGHLHASRDAVFDEGSPPAQPAAENSTRMPAVETPAAVIVAPRIETGSGRRIRISPLARRIAAGAGVDPASIAGTGPSGAVLRRDVEAAIARNPGGHDAKSQAVPVLATATLPPERLEGPVQGSVPGRRPLAGMRKAIATRMMQSLQTSAQMTGFGRIDMAEAVKLRRACIEAEAELGVRITYTDLVLKAAATALADMPEMNASIVGEEIVSWQDVNLGLAVALDDGLIVPVIRNADRKTIVDIGRERQDLADRARSGRLQRDELEGGTFSLSNFGSYGGDFETPILSPPQSALLGIGRIADEPVVRDGAIVIRPMMMISLTFDHRLIDGAVAGRFRGRLKALLENPGLMMARMR